MNLCQCRQNVLRRRNIWWMVGQLFQQNKSIVFIFLYLKSYVRVYLLTKIKYSFFFLFLMEWLPRFTSLVYYSNSSKPDFFLAVCCNLHRVLNEYFNILAVWILSTLEKEYYSTTLTSPIISDSFHFIFHLEFLKLCK